MHDTAYYPKNNNVKVKSFPGADVRDMHDNITNFRRKPEYIILHVGTNDPLNLPPNEILDKILDRSYRDKQRL